MESGNGTKSFCTANEVEVLTNNLNPSDFTKKMMKIEPSFAEGSGQIVPPLPL